MSSLIVTPLGTVSPYPKDGKNCPGFLIEYNGNKIMLDCGNGCLSMLDLANDLDKLKVFISHLHPDHYGDLTSLMQAALVYKRLGFINEDIDIFIPDGDRVKCDYNGVNVEGWGCSHTISDHIIDYKYLTQISEKYPVNMIGYDSIDMKTDGIKISTKQVPHQIHTFAFRIDTPDGSIVYSADTGTKNDLRKFAKDCDLFICESTFLKGQCRNEDAHLFAWEAASIARDAKVKQLLLTHFWPEIDKSEYLNEACEIFENTEVAEEGKRLILTK